MSAIVALLAVGLSAHFAAIVPGYPWFAYPAAALVTTLLFVLSLLAHEMAHAIVAQRNGVGVDGITLWLLGGVARLRNEARTPGADFRISAIGPVASLLVAATFGALAGLAGLAEMSPLAVAVPSYLAMINVVLAVFNTIPAAPLDGGRILRAMLWAWRGDRRTAAVVAARSGRIFGVALIVLGLLQTIGGSGGGLWLIMLGLFMTTMAAAEERHAHARPALAGILVGDVMAECPEPVIGSRTVAEFLRDIASRGRHSAFPVIDHVGRLHGLLTFGGLRRLPAERRSTALLYEVAYPVDEVPRARPDEALSTVLDRLGKSTEGRALVFADDRLAGIISRTDISRAVELHDLGVRFEQMPCSTPGNGIDGTGVTVGRGFDSPGKAH
ncbi:MAG TPA: site-2 protease family protein [Mycobacterium sp.]